VHDQLQSVARVLAGDIAYGRSLAVANSSNYRFTFETIENRYILRHSGANGALNVLPESPFRSPSDPPDQYIVDLAGLPRLGGHNVRLLTVTGVNQAIINTADLEFGPLGETTRSQETLVWLAGGRATDTRYLAVHVNPVTGLTSIGQFTSLAPVGVAGSQSLAPSP
jgi:hypothetical protein